MIDVMCAAQTLVHGDQVFSVYPVGIPSLPAINGGYGKCLHRLIGNII